MKTRIAPYLKNSLLAILILSASFGISVVFQKLLGTEEHITTLFAFGVFLISIVTEGYVYGIVSAFVATFSINYAFAFPYFSFNFTLPENLVSALIMITISLMTSALTTKLKRWQMLKAEGEREMMRANLLRAVSHDLRTPLTTIYGSSSAILDNYATLTEQQKLRMVTGIKEDSEWLIRMVENLLSITRLDAGEVEIIKTPTVLEELIDSVIHKFRKRYPTQAVDIDIPDDIVTIPMDAILIEQVLVNLLENAVQHAVGMEHLGLKVFVIGKNAIFEVTDDGCGIEKERLNKIFTGYYDSAEPPSDMKKRNAGIGLSVCATIVNAHGGSISAENAKECGAVFRFSLETEVNSANDE